MSVASYVTAQILRALPRAQISRAIGRLADRPWGDAVGRAAVEIYARAYGVDFDECADRSGFPTFDAFFTRKLRDGVRTIDPDVQTIVSPADGRVESMAAIEDGGTFRVKGRPYTVEELVGDAREAKRFYGGAGVVVYLSPRDYHRVHAPVGGVIRCVRSLPGDYYPVNAVGMRHVPKLFARNRRVAIEIDADGGLGRVTVVMVVAMIVGRITAVGFAEPDVPFGEHRIDPPLQIRRGEEIGVFHLGSTAVVLAERKALGRWRVSEGPVRYGQALLEAPGRAALHDSGSNGAGGLGRIHEGGGRA